MIRLALLSLILSATPLLLLAQISDTDTLPTPAQTSGNEGQIFNIVENYPEFPGGQMELFTFLKETLRYPKAARENNNEGTVTLGFVVEADGTLSNFVIKRSSGFPDLDEEAMRVAKLMPNWNPGLHQGKPVRVSQTLPVKFKLAGPPPKKDRRKKGD